MTPDRIRMFCSECKHFFDASFYEMHLRCPVCDSVNVKCTTALDDHGERMDKLRKENV